jgi:hypothetical protein
VSKETHKPPPPSGIPGPFSLADQNVLLSDALLESGFKDVAIERMNVTFTFDSPEEYTRFHQAIAAPVHATLANETQEKKEIWKAVTETVSKYADNNTGSVKLDNEVICISGTK